MGDYSKTMLGEEPPSPQDLMGLAPNVQYNELMKSKKIPDVIKVVASLDSLDKLVDQPTYVFQKNQPNQEEILTLYNYIKGDEKTVNDIEYKIAEEYWSKELEDEKGKNKNKIKEYAKGSINSLRKSKAYKAFKLSIINEKSKGKVSNIYGPILDYLSKEDGELKKQVKFIEKFKEKINEYAQG